MKKKIVAMLVASVMIMAFFTACEDAGMSAEYDSYNDNSIYEPIDCTGDYNYARYSDSDDIIEIDSCVKYLDRDTGLWMYEIGVNGKIYRVEYYAIDLYAELPGEEWEWKD